MMFKCFPIGFLFFSIIVCLPGCKHQAKTGDQPALISGWERIGPGGGGATFIPTFSYHQKGNFLVRCDMTGTYLSKDGGNSYQLINIPGGASCFAFDPTDSNTIYIGSAALHKSIDGGKHWIRIFPKQAEILKESFVGDHADYELSVADTALYVKDAGKIGTIKVDPVLPGNLYFSMGNYFFYSSNAGATWTKENLQQNIDYFYSNTTAAKDDLYIFTKEKIFIFNKATKKISTREIPVALAPAHSFTAGTIKNSATTVIYALHHDFDKQNPWDFGHSEVWTSTDLGLTWKKSVDALITNSKSGISPSLTMISCSEYDAANAYVVTNRYQEKMSGGLIDWYGALKTGDSGDSWHWAWKGGGGSGQYGIHDAEDAPNLRDAWVHKAFGSEFIQLFDVGVSPQDGNIAIVTDWYRVMKTTDGGNSWQEAYSKTNPDSTFTSRGMDVTTNYGVHFDPFDSLHIAISYTDIGYHHSYDGGKTWNRSVAGVPTEWVNTCYWVAFDPVVKNKMWSAWSGLHDFPRGKMTRNPKWRENGRGGICVSEDGGKTWKPEVAGMGSNSPATSIVLDPKSAIGNRTLYAAVYGKGVFKSTDDGRTWQKRNKGIDSNTCAFELTISGNGTLFLTVSPTPVHPGGKKDTAVYSGAVYRSTDGAETWTKLTVNKGMLFPNGIETDPADPKRIYLGCWSAISLSDMVGGDVTRATGGNKMIDMPGGIFMSEDSGDSWTSIFDQHQYVYDVTVDPYHPGRLYCNTFNKVAWRSDDRGRTWKKLQGYDFHWGHRIIVDRNDHEKVFITTYGSSVWHGKPGTD